MMIVDNQHYHQSINRNEKKEKKTLRQIVDRILYFFLKVLVKLFF
jgi:hypothetical protein